jgi:histidinol-phosphate aminotransferase
MSIKPRKAVENLPVYTPAKSIDSTKREFGFERVIKLAGNENTLGFSPLTREAIKEISSYYPDGASLNLTEKLSKKLNVRQSQIVFGNGSFELLFLIGLAFLEQGEETIIPEPSFNWYKNVTLIMGGNIVSVPLKDFKTDLDAIEAAITDKTKIIWLCNPNNPTGTIFTESELTAFLDRVRDDIVVVLDEAYYDFVAEEGYPDSIKLLERYKNIIILRTFSKLEGLAAFRIGYGIADEELTGYINKVRMPINVNAAAQLAAYAAVDDDSFRQRTLSNVRSGLESYYQLFDRLGLKYIKSNTNFIFFDTGIDSGYVVNEFLKKGILIRGGAEFGYPTMLRISVGTPEENKQVIELLENILNKTEVTKK